MWKCKCLCPRFQVEIKNLSASDVVRGQREAILAVVWTLILTFSDGQIQDFDGLRAFLLHAESNVRVSDVTQRMSSPQRDSVPEFPYSFLTVDASINQERKPFIFHTERVSNSCHTNSSATERLSHASDLTDSVPSSGKMEYISPDREIQTRQPDFRAANRPLKPILKPTPQIAPPDQAVQTSESWRGKTARQRMYEVKEKSRAVLLRNQVQSQHHVSSFKKRKDRSASPKQLEDQNRNLHLVHPVQEFELQSDQTRKEETAAGSRPLTSLLSSLWNSSPARNALRVALPLQLLMLVMVGMSFMVPNLDEITCLDCLKENNYIKEFGPVFYHAFPPAV